MQEYPVYTVRGETGGERATTVELRVQMEAGGGLPDMETAEAVVQALATAMTAAGALRVTATKDDLQSSSIPVT
ncbi:hypothetical protein [Streptomyces sp. NPDC059597]|uniref:hypothetical protein n=1 Tax=Streptomyces sp. NPDC059597 TaxID=3346879 RepID=UPI0036AE1B59